MNRLAVFVLLVIWAGLAVLGTGAATSEPMLTVETGYGSVLVTVDGASYMSDGSGRVRVPVNGGGHWVSVQPVIHEMNLSRVVFSQWLDGTVMNPRLVFVEGNTTLVAVYKTQYYIELVSPYGTPVGSGWYDMGGNASITIEKEVQLDGLMGLLGAKHIFDHWTTQSGGHKDISTSSAVFAVQSPNTITAVWKDNVQEVTQLWLVLGLILIIGALVIKRRRKRRSLIEAKK